MVKYYGEIHGEMDIHPPAPAIYLSRKPNSDNLHSNLFVSDVTILKIDTSALDMEQCYPDDFFLSDVADGEMLSTVGSIMKALNIDRATAKSLFGEIENADNVRLPLILKPFWKWYLLYRNGGEISYTADIPASAVVDSRHL